MVQWITDPQDATVLSPLASAGITYGFWGRKMHPEAKSVKQVHGTLIVDALTSQDHTEADGLYLSEKPGVIAVKTADCLPVLLAAPKERCVIALHAGWRGLSAGILQRSFDLGLGIPPSSFYALLGPAIGIDRFEVGPEVVEAFSLPSEQFARCVRKGRDDRSHIDLTQCAVFMLLNLGVPDAQIAALRSCTYTHPELWPSYRRDGRADISIWSWISIG